MRGRKKKRRKKEESGGRKRKGESGEVRGTICNKFDVGVNNVGKSLAWLWKNKKKKEKKKEEGPGAPRPVPAFVVYKKMLTSYAQSYAQCFLRGFTPYRLLLSSSSWLNSELCTTPIYNLY